MGSRTGLLLPGSAVLGPLGWRWVRNSQTETRHLGGRLTRYRPDQDIAWVSALLKLLAGSVLMIAAVRILQKAVHKC